MLKAATFRRRVVCLVIIISVLASLCISASAGASFLSLTISEEATVDAQAEQSSGLATPAPVPTKRAKLRIEPAFASPYRLGERHRQAHPATHTPQGVLKQPFGLSDGPPVSYRPLISSAPPSSVPLGRAPPRLS